MPPNLTFYPNGTKLHQNDDGSISLIPIQDVPGVIDDAVADNAPTASAVTRSASKIAALIAAALASVSRVAINRTALGSTAIAAIPVYLMEGRRKGWFTHYTASEYLAEFGITAAAAISADSAQGVVVADGSGGVWRRSLDGPVKVKWFGAVADNATDDGAAFTAAIAYLKATRIVSGYGYGGGGSGDLFVPAGTYYLGTTTLDITHTMRIYGESNGPAGSPSTVLRWADGATGIRVQSFNTTGASGSNANSSVTPNGIGSCIERLFLKGGFTTTEGENHAIHLRGSATVRDVFIEYWSGDGIRADTTSGSGGATEGASNSSRIEGFVIRGCRTGIYLHGADANTIWVAKGSILFCRQWGAYDGCFLGNTWIGVQFATNGRDGSVGSNGIPVNCVYYGGFRYQVIAGQEVGASTNAPTGAATSNTWWEYLETAAAFGTIIPTWLSGATYRAGGSMRTDNANARTKIVGCYAESDQNKAQLVGPTVVDGGIFVNWISTSSTALVMSVDSAGQLSVAKFRVTTSMAALAAQFGPTTGAADSITYLENSNSNSFLQGRYWSAGAPTNIGHITFKNGQGILINPQNSGWNIQLQNNGAAIADVDATGVNLASGKTLRVNGTQVVAARQTGAPAAATDAATTMALVNDIRTKLIAHGLIS